ncbi:MAG: universal stress protein [Sphingomonas sp.]|uniref:universal stress protein n=1 Tax=Sphingomonas sp. TaxID=28214 RepID=UPI001AFF67B4|nr:universal stress protein [Sphingomonas sp.]MBO9623377.1 universal stress protein [Sphingomonas sp.]
MYQHILISTDGSEIAQKGLDHGLDLARTIGAAVTLVSVAEGVMPYTSDDMGLSMSVYLEYATNQKRAAEKILADAKASAGLVGVAVDTVCLDNVLPAQAIVDTAGERGCDLIVMASHGRRGIRRLLLGSVTSEVLVISTVPVLVVR